MTDKKEPTPFSPWPLHKVLVACSVLFFAEALYLNQYWLAVVVLIYVLAWGVPRAFFAKRWRSNRNKRLANLALYALTAVLAFAGNNFNNQLAERRTEQVIAAVDAFHGKLGKYPRSLDELVPQFLPEVPKAKVGFGITNFYYLERESSATLMYVVFPPFGRRTYDFGTKEFGYMD